MSRVRFLALALLVLCPALGYGQTSEQSFFGVVSAAGIAHDTCRQEDLTDLRVGWVRAAFLWADIERSKGDFLWDEADRLISDMDARGINVFWDFSSAPCWANGRPCNSNGTTADGDHIYPPLNQQDLYDYVTAVVTRYRDLGYRNIYWGTWNEPNLSQFYVGGGNGQTNISRFIANELQTTVNAIRAADPEAKVVVGELSTAPGNYSTVFGYLRQMLNSVSGRFDVISQHLYDGGDTCSGRLAGIDQLRSSLVGWGYGNFPIWITETGLNQSQATKNSFLQCFWNGLRSSNRSLWWKAAYWYRFETEYSWGLLNDGPAPCTYTTNSTYDTYRSLISTWPARPSAPGLSATPGNAQVSLSWTSVIGALGYNVYRAQRSGGPYKLLLMGTSGTQYLDGGVTNGITYYYVVSTTGTAGDGPYSIERPVTPQPTPPPSPTGLSATAGNARVVLTWNAAAGASSYRVKRSATSGGPYTVVASNVTTTGYTNTGLTNGTTYYFVVSAVNAAGESPNSNQASAAPQGLQEPTGLGAGPAGNGAVSLAWLPSSGAASYKVKGATTSGGPYAVMANGVTTTTYTKTGLINGTTYYFVVSAVDSGGESGSSAEASATPRRLVGSNVLANSSFETGTGADATSWTEDPSHARSSDRSALGSWSLRSTFRGAGASSIATSAAAVLIDAEYEFSAWIFKAGTGAGCIDMDDIPGEAQLCAGSAGQWQFVSGAWYSGGTTGVRVRAVTDGSPGADIWFDRPQLAQSNLIRNPSFESAGAASTDANRWTEGTNHARSSDRAHDGGWSLKSTYTGGGINTYTSNITIKENTSYRLSAWIYKASTTGSACIDMNDRPGELQLCGTQVNQWEFVSGTWTSGPETPPLPVVVRLVTDGNPNGSIWFDEVRFTFE